MLYFIEQTLKRQIFIATRIAFLLLTNLSVFFCQYFPGNLSVHSRKNGFSWKSDQFYNWSDLISMGRSKKCLTYFACLLLAIRVNLNQFFSFLVIDFFQSVFNMSFFHPFEIILNSLSKEYYKKWIGERSLDGGRKTQNGISLAGRDSRVRRTCIDQTTSGSRTHISRTRKIQF